MKGPLSMPEAKEIIRIHPKMPCTYDQSLKEYRVTNIKDMVLQKIADSVKMMGLKCTLKIKLF